MFSGQPRTPESGSTISLTPPTRPSTTRSAKLLFSSHQVVLPAHQIVPTKFPNLVLSRHLSRSTQPANSSPQVIKWCFSLPKHCFSVSPGGSSKSPSGSSESPSSVSSKSPRGSSDSSWSYFKSPNGSSKSSSGSSESPSGFFQVFKWFLRVIKWFL